MNAPATTPGQSSYLNVRASEEGFVELTKKGARAVFIPKNQIEFVTLRFGTRAERPILQVLMAMCLLALGAAGVYLVIEGGLRGLYWGSGLTVFGFIGVYSLYEAVKKGHYLAVTCPSGMRKLILLGKASESDFSNFAKDASAYGYRFGQMPLKSF